MYSLWMLLCGNFFIFSLLSRTMHFSRSKIRLKLIFFLIPFLFVVVVVTVSFSHFCNFLYIKTPRELISSMQPMKLVVVVTFSHRQPIGHATHNQLTCELNIWNWNYLLLCIKLKYFRFGMFSMWFLYQQQCPRNKLLHTHWLASRA